MKRQITIAVTYDIEKNARTLEVSIDDETLAEVSPGGDELPAILDLSRWLYRLHTPHRGASLVWAKYAIDEKTLANPIVNEDQLTDTAARTILGELLNRVGWSSSGEGTV